MTPLAQYVPAHWSGINESGISPIGDRVLVLPDKPVEKTEGGVLLPDQRKDSDGMAAETGVLVAAGDTAWKWNSDRTRAYDGVKPQIGQRVWFERYAGAELTGADGIKYKLMDDRCIGAIADTSAAVGMKPPAVSKIAKVIKPPLVMARGA
jgi:co-chaperonin GroES (HSP10)